MKAAKAAVIYARVSRDKGEDGYSIAQQVADAKRKAKELGYSIAGICIDNGVSGYKPPRQLGKAKHYREGLTDALSLIEAGKAQAVIAYRLDRVSRLATEQGLLLLKWIAERKATVVLTGETLPADLGTATGVFNLTQMLSVATYYRALGSERVRASKAYMIEQGLKPGGVTAYGHNYAEEANVVRRCFKDFVAGKSLMSITAYLNSVCKTVKGNHWRLSVVKAMLANPLHIGQTKHGVESKDYKAIIPPELFARAQALLASRKGIRERTAGRLHLVSGLVRCEHCKRKLEVMSGKPTKDGSRPYFYKCKTPDCTGAPQIQEREYIRLITDLLPRIKTQRVEVTTANVAKIQKLKASIAALEERYQKGEYDDLDSYFRLSDGLRKNIRSLEGEEQKAVISTETVNLESLPPTALRSAICERIEAITVGSKLVVHLNKAFALVVKIKGKEYKADRMPHELVKQGRGSSWHIVTEINDEQAYKLAKGLKLSDIQVSGGIGS